MKTITPHATSLLRLLTLAVSLAFFTQVAAANVEEPRTMLESVSKQLLDTLKTDQAKIHSEPQRLFDIVDQVLVPHVDLETMSRWVLGKHWRTATPEQRTRFTAEFRTLMVRFYTSALLDDPKQIDTILAHADTIITFQPSTSANDPQRSTVRSEVHLPNGPVVPVVFNLHLKDGVWRVFDVNVDGISLITSYRNSFAQQVAQSGLEALIDDLAARNKKLMEQADAEKKDKPAK
ncbi:MAG TPA: ABC transporter substrate-binding protein [Gammaproteobacteria bacterium]